MRTRLLATLLIVTLLVGYYRLGTGYLELRREHEQLGYQIAGASQTLARMPRPPQGLEERLAAARADLADAEAHFPSRLNSTRIINAILELAGDNGVKAIPLITRPWAVAKNGEHDYYVFRLNILATGSFPQLVEFTDRLENGEFPTLIIESLNVTRDTGTGIAGPAFPVSASLDLAIYTRSPPAD